MLCIIFFPACVSLRVHLCGLTTSSYSCLSRVVCFIDHWWYRTRSPLGTSTSASLSPAVCDAPTDTSPKPTPLPTLPLLLDSDLTIALNSFCSKIITQFSTPFFFRGDNAKDYFSNDFCSYMIHHGLIHHSSKVITPNKTRLSNKRMGISLKSLELCYFIYMLLKNFGMMLFLLPVSWLTECLLLFIKVKFLSQFCNTNLSLIFLDVHVLFSIFGLKSKNWTINPSSVFLGLSSKKYKCFSPDLGRYIISSIVTFFISPLSSLSRPFLLLVSQKRTIFFFLKKFIHLPLSLPRLHPYQFPVALLLDPPFNKCTFVILKIQHPLWTKPLWISLLLYWLTPSPISTSQDPTLDLPIAIRKGTHSCVTHHPIASFIQYKSRSPSSQSFVATLDTATIPKTISEPLVHDGWRHARIEEMLGLDHNQTWDLVPSSKCAIGCKWYTQLKSTQMKRLLISRLGLLPKDMPKLMALTTLKTSLPGLNWLLFICSSRWLHP